MNLHLTTAEWEQIKAAGSAVLFRAGETCVRCGGSPMGFRPNSGAPCRRCHGTGVNPPAEFVEAGQPCETCDEEGHWPHLTDDGWVDDCPECLNGKRRVAAVVPCDGIIGSRWRINDTGGTFTVRTVAGQYAYVANERGTERRILAHRIRSSRAKTGYTRIDDGLVTVGHVVVTFGPLVVADNIDRPSTTVRRYARIDSGRLLDVNRDNGEVFDRGPLPPGVDPQSLVGQWAIGVEVVS